MIDGKAMKITFHKWLSSQSERDDSIGQFASVVTGLPEPEQTNKRKNDQHFIWTSWLLDLNPSFELIDLFNESWREFQETN